MKLSDLMRYQLRRVGLTGTRGLRLPYGPTMDALLARGLVDRQDDPADPRSTFKIWRITDQGQRFVR